MTAAAPELGLHPIGAIPLRANRVKAEKPMTNRKNPPQPFRRSQVVSPVPSGRRFGKAKFEKKTFDIYITDIETGDETLAITIYAPTQREALQIKRLQSSSIVRRITYAAFTAVEIASKQNGD